MAAETTQPSVADREAALKLEKLSADLEMVKLDLERKRREELNAAKAAELDLRTKQAATERAEIELENARRLTAQAKAQDSENGEYAFLDPVNWETVRVAILKLNELSRRFPNKPLTVTLNSPGGTVLPGLALFDHIRELSKRGHKMIVKVRGMAASMGGILLQAGDLRVIGPEAMVLIHEVSAGTAGKVSEMQDRVDFSKRLWQKCAKLLANKSKLSAQEIMEKADRRDWWLDAEQAKELGFADEIG